MIFKNFLARIKPALAFTILFLLTLIYPHVALCQDLNPKKDSPGVIFKNGVYTTYEEFKSNDPAKKYIPVVLSPKEVTEYLKTYPPQSFISSSGQYIWVGHYKADGEFVRVPPDSIWCFVKDNEVVIKHQEYLVKLDAKGALCHYKIDDALFAEELNIKNNQQYFFEFETGKIKRFKLDNFLSVLQQNDMELYQKILRMDSYKKMRASMFDFLLLYNTRHPLSTADK